VPGNFYSLPKQRFDRDGHHLDQRQRSARDSADHDPPIRNRLMVMKFAVEFSNSWLLGEPIFLIQVKFLAVLNLPACKFWGKN
jgi:hypothetical protein